MNSLPLRWLVTVLSVVWSASAYAQAPAPQWHYENVGTSNLIPGCVSGMTLAGFDIDPQGRPVAAWREDNGCGGSPRVFWSRFENGAWQQREFLSERRYQGGGMADKQHQMALRPSDGNPFLIYSDAGPWNEINTYRTDLGLNPNGGVSTYLQNVVPPQNCDYAMYSLAFGPGDLLPQFASGISSCNGWGPLRLNGSDLNPSVWSAKPSLTVGTDGTRHVIWNTGSEVYYARVPAGATQPSHQVQLFNANNRFGGENRILEGPGGVLHAIVRGPDVTADWDLGSIVYLRSADQGLTWSAPQYVDPHDDPAVQSPWNGNSDLSFALDEDGTPAVTFWRWNSELWYAKRDGPNGTWTQQLVTALAIQNGNGLRSNQLRFDEKNRPVIAFFDPVAKMLRLARPVPAGVTMPVDVSVKVTGTPVSSFPGAPGAFTITVANNSAVNLDRVVLRNRLADGVAMTSATPAPANDGAWVMALSSGESRTFVVNVTLPFAIGSYVNVATATTDAVDAKPADNSATTAVLVKADACFAPHASGSELIGWWRGDNSTLNSGPLNDLANGPNVTYAPAVIGNGFLFNGTNAGVSYGHYTDDNYFYPGAGSFTVQAFIKTSSAAGNISSRYECTSGGCSNTAWFLYLDGGRLRAYFRDSAGNIVDLTGARRVDDGVFHHVAFVLDRATSEGRLYVDGQLDGTASAASLGPIRESNGQATPITIGATSGYWGNLESFFTGIIDEFAVHKRALSAAELGTIAAAATNPACADPVAVAGSDIALSLTANPLTIAPTGIATVNVQVRNNGSVPLSSVAMELTTSGALIDTAPDAVVSGGVATMVIGKLAPGESQWISARVMAGLNPGTLTITARHVEGGDAVPGNDSASASVVIASDACFVPPTGLIGRWRFDEDGNDAVGGRTAQLRETTAFDVGRADRALSLELPRGYAEIADAAALKPQRFTIGAWINPASTTDWDTIVAKGASGADSGIYWWDDTYWLGLAAGGYPTLITYHGGGIVGDIRSTTKVSPGAWHHVAATFDGSVTRLFVDGVQVAQAVMNRPLYYDVNAVPLTIGEDWQGGSANGASFIGLIDEVTLHDRALAAADVLAMVAGGSSECHSPQAPVANDDLAATAWKTAVTVDAAGNDTDPNGEPLSIVAITVAPQHGFATVQNNRIVYTPWAFTGVDTLRYQISDGQGGVAEATVSIDVSPALPIPPPIVAGTFAHGQLTWVRNAKPAPVASSLQLRFDGSFVWPVSAGLPASGSQVQSLVLLHLKGTDYEDTVAGVFTVSSVNQALRVVTGSVTVTEVVPDSAFPIALDYGGCCRLTSLQNGNAGSSFSLRSVIDLSTTTRSPSSSVVPRISAVANVPLAFQLPSLAVDGFTNRFALAAGSGLSTAAPPQFVLGPTGFVNWTPSAPGLYAVQFNVIAQDASNVARANSPVEVLFEVFPQCTQNCPVVTVSIAGPSSLGAIVGLETSFDVTVSSNMAGYQATVTTTPLASGMQMRALTAVGQSTTYRVSWTPRPGDLSAFVCFQGRATGAGQVASSFGQTCANWNLQASQLRQMTGVLRTFSATHPDMNRPVGAPVPTVVSLDVNRKPVRAGGSGATAFGDWFNDVAGVNQSSVHSLWLANAQQSDPDLYTYRSTNLVPIENAQFFTYEVHDTVRYTPGQRFTFKTSGDLWIFVNGAPVIDLHGGAAEQSATLDLDARAASLQLQPGQLYAMDIFYAHRANNPAAIQLQINHPQWWEPWFVVDKPAFVAQDVDLLGDARIESGALRLLDPIAVGPGAGAAWLQAVHDLSRGFKLEFDFVASSPAFEGFAVAIAQAPALGGSGGGLGYENIPHSLAIEFDASRQAALNDPAHAHIAVHTGGASPNSAVEDTALNFSPPSVVLPLHFANATPQHVRIEYAPTPTQNAGWLRVWMNNNIMPALEAMVDMARFGAWGAFDLSAPPPASPEVLLDAARGAIGFTSGRTTTGAIEIRSARLTTVRNTAPFLDDYVSAITLVEGLSPLYVFTPVDTDGDRVSVTQTGTLPQGVTFSNRAFAGAPAAGTRGTYPVTLTLSDGLNTTAVPLDVIVNHPPVAVDDALTVPAGQWFNLAAVLANDLDQNAGQVKRVVSVSQPQHGTLGNPAYGEWHYRPHTGYYGTDTFTYTMSDGFEMSTATVVVTVPSPALPPSLLQPFADLQANEDTPPLVVEAVGHFDDAQGDGLSYSASTSAPWLAVQVDGASGRITLTPGANAHGAATIEVRAITPQGLFASDTFAVTIAPLNDAPLVRAPLVNREVPGGAPADSIEIASAFTDVDGDALTFTVASSNPSAVTAAIVAGRLQLTYVATATKQSTITVTAADPAGATVATSFTARVVVPNRPPTTNMADLLLFEGQPAIFQIFLGDVDGDPITASLTGLPPGVTTTMRAPGEDGLPFHHLRFDGAPAAGSAGTYPVVLTFSDGTVTLTRPHVITVRPPNRAPLATNDSVEGNTGQYEIRVPVLANDSDPEGDDLRVVSATQPLSGEVEVREDEVVYRVHAQGYLTERFTYTVEDEFGAQATATVTVRLLEMGVNIVARAVPALAVRANQVFDVDIVVSNEGLAPAAAVLGELNIAGVDLVAASLPTQDGNRIELGALSGGESRRVTLTLKAINYAPQSAGLELFARAQEETTPPDDNRAAIAIAVQPEFCFAPPAGLLGFWRADGNQDSVPRFGSDRGGFDYAPSRLGQAFAFDGASSRYAVFQATEYIAKPVTLAAWTKWAASGSGLLPVAMTGSSNMSRILTPQIVLGIEDGRPVMQVFGEDSVVVLRGTTTVPPDSWAHLAATYDGVTARMYLNGIEVAHQDVGVWWRSHSDVAIGFAMVGGYDLTEVQFNGLIDDVMVYARALTPAEIRRVVSGDPINCAPSTQPAASLEIDAAPTFVPATGVVDVTVRVTNTGDGHLESPVLRYEPPPMATVLDASPAPHVFPPWEPEQPPTFMLPPLLAGESTTVSLRITAPAVDGVFTHRAAVRDGHHGELNAIEASLTVTPAACFAVPAGLTQEWRGDTDPSAPAGRVGTGYYSGPYLDNDPQLVPGPAFSLAGWVRLSDTTAATLVGIFSRDMPWEEGHRVSLGVANGRVLLLTKHTDGVQRRLVADSPLPENRWVHIAAAFDGTMARVYIDGALAASQSIGVPLAARESREAAVIASVSGYADEVLIYDRALELDEVRRLVAGDANCAINQWPVVKPIDNQFNRVGDAVEFTVSASDPDAADVLTFAGAGLPAGLSLDPATGRISGVVAPEGSGSRTVTISVSDGRLPVATTFTWVVPHRVTYRVAQGGLITIGEQTCDATAQPATCGIDVADGEWLPTVTYLESQSTGYPWSTVAPPLALHNAVHQSSEIAVDWVNTFGVTFNRWVNAPLVFASIGQQDPTQRDYFFCDYLGLYSENGACGGRAPVGSTIEIFGTSNNGFIFTGFSGACTGMSCTLTIGDEPQVVQANWDRRTAPVTIDAGPGGLVSVRNASGTEVAVCDGGTTGASCVVNWPTNTHINLVPRRPIGTSPRWRWDSLLGPFQSNRDIEFTVTTATRVGVMFQEEVQVRVPFFTTALDRPFVSEPPAAFLCANGADGFACYATVPAMTTLTLRDDPAHAAGLIAWSGACAGTGDCTVFTDRKIDINAAFGYPTTLTVGAGGVVHVGSATCSAINSPCQFVLPPQPTSFTTTLAHASFTTVWTGTFSPTSSLDQPSVTVMPDRPRSIGVTFMVPFSVTTSGYTVPGMSVIADLPGTPADRRLWSGKAPFGTSVQFTTTPWFSTGWSVRWEGACASPANCQVTMDRGGIEVRAVVNGAPQSTMAGGSLTHPEDGGDAFFEPLSLFTDPEASVFSLVPMSMTPAGIITATTTSNGRLRITPLPDMNGSVTLTVRGVDGAGNYTERPVFVTIRAVNDAPSVSVQATTVRSGEVSLIALTGLSAGPNEAGQGLVVTASAADPVMAGAITVVNGQLRIAPPTRSVTATTLVTVRVEDVPVGESPLSITRTFMLTILPGGNTPAGSNIQVAATGPMAVSPISVNFSQVTTPGQTTYESRTTGMAPPDGFVFGTPPVWFDIHTTATFVAPLRVCITYPAGQYTNPSALKLFHYENGRWVDRTVSVNTKTRVVCASVSSLSPFALAEPIAIEGRMRGDGRVDASGVEVGFDFTVAERKLGRERGWIELTLRTPKQGKKKETVNRFESTDVEEIFFSDDPAFRPSRQKRQRPAADSVAFIGTGRWNGARGYTFEAVATDQGEPGRGRDRLAITIFDPAGNIVATIDDAIDSGNIQSDRLKPEHWR